jgi:hypothetical protein
MSSNGTSGKQVLQQISEESELERIRRASSKKFEL